MIVLIVLAATGVDAFSEPAEVYALVVSDDVVVEAIEKEEVQRLFLFRQRFWRSGQRVNVLLAEPDLVEHSFVLDEVYEMTYPSLRRYILERLYQGEIDLPPKVVSSYEDAIRFVASGNGVVAIVPLDSVPDAGVRVLTIDGTRPGADGYPLKR